jgi:hypothetical protein
MQQRHAWFMEDCSCLQVDGHQRERTTGARVQPLQEVIVRNGDWRHGTGIIGTITRPDKRSLCDHIS